MISLVSALGFALALQLPETGNTAAVVQGAAARRRPFVTDTSVVAVRTSSPPVIDGVDDDSVWRVAPPITAFREWQPTEGKEPRFRTEARVAYDAANLFVFVRAFDPHPDSVIRILERRDTFTPSDMIWIFVDSYHDRRTGYEFGVNAAGVKIDQAIYDDGREDGAWDAVWDAATRIDSLGWTAEFRIPLSQMRYGTDREHTFGFTIDRDIYRYNERVIISPTPPGCRLAASQPWPCWSTTVSPPTSRTACGSRRRCPRPMDASASRAPGPPSWWSWRWAYAPIQPWLNPPASTAIAASW